MHKKVWIYLLNKNETINRVRNILINNNLSILDNIGQVFTQIAHIFLKNTVSELLKLYQVLIHFLCCITINENTLILDYNNWMDVKENCTV